MPARQVRAFLAYMDFTLGWYLMRENDLMAQSLMVQIFVPKARVVTRRRSNPGAAAAAPAAVEQPSTGFVCKF